MTKREGLLTGALIGLIIYGIVLFYPLYGGVPSQPSNYETQQINPTDTQQTQNPKTQNSQTQYSFRTDELLNTHYRKHGHEFGAISKDEYVRRANDLILSNDPKLRKKYQKKDADKIYFLESTNEFLALSTDGYIRTYFITDDGIAYYNRQ